MAGGVVEIQLHCGSTAKYWRTRKAPPLIFHRKPWRLSRFGRVRAVGTVEKRIEDGW